MCHSRYMKINKLKKFYYRLRDYFQAPLPVGMQEFDNWTNRIIATYDFPDNDSTKFALAAQILHIGPMEANKRVRDFYLMTYKSMAAQVAAQSMQDIKEKHKALAAAEAAEKAENEAKAKLSLVPNLEATPTEEAASNVNQPLQN